MTTPNYDFLSREDLLKSRQELIEQVAALTKELQKKDDDLKCVIDIAHEHGWNGVENSKILWVFLDERLKELQEESEQLKANGRILTAENEGIKAAFECRPCVHQKDVDRLTDIIKTNYRHLSEILTGKVAPKTIIIEVEAALTGWQLVVTDGIGDEEKLATRVAEHIALLMMTAQGFAEKNAEQQKAE